jgi:transposase InsO family protein
VPQTLPPPLSHQQLKKLARKRCPAWLAVIEHMPVGDGCESLGSVIDDSKVCERARAILHEYEDVFPSELPHDALPVHDVEHTIPLVPNHVPPCRSPYRLAQSELDELRKQLDEYIRLGFIRPSASPYGAPVLFVRKKDNSMRMCVDFRALNKLTIRQRTPLPLIDDLLNRLHGARVFSTLDLRTAYHQVRIAEEDVHKTAFRTRYGQYEWLVMPFGLTDAPSTFQRLINHVCKPLLDKCALAFLDDICVYSPNEEQHEHDLRAVLDLLRKHRLYAKLSKCVFFASECVWCGHVVSGDGLRPDPAKVETVIKWPEPKTQHDVRSFMGLGQFFHRYIKDCARIASPLYDLTSIGAPKSWETLPEAARLAFEQLKVALSSPPVLRIPDPSLPFVLSTDASGFALGGCLMQRDEQHHLHPCAYESRRMSPPERNYGVYEQELLALVHACRKWRHYLFARPVCLVSDHQPLSWLMDQKTLSPRQARWLEFLAEFDLSIQHAPGTSPIMRVPDALSRRPCACDDCVPLDAIDVCAPITTIRVHESMYRQIRAAYSADKYFAPIFKHLNNPSASVPVSFLQRVSHFHLRDGCIYLGNRLCVPSSDTLRADILHACHDVPSAGHLGFDKTYARMHKSFYFPGMYVYVRKYVLSCDTCQRTKPVCQKLPGLLQPLPIPHACWSDISFDFICQLPVTRGHRYDCIFVVVCRLCKAAHFLPCRVTDKAEDVARLFMREIFRLHGMPATIVCDRDSRFTSRFWTALMSLLGTRMHMSTAFHPQTDGQTERVNRILEDMLRAFVCARQSDWDVYLPSVEFAYNNCVHSSTGFTPFYMMYGHDPITPDTLLSTTPLPDTCVCSRDLVLHMRNIICAARDHIREAVDRQVANADIHRRHVSFSIGDRVMLDISRVCDALRPADVRARKLEDRWVGPFTVVGTVSSGLAYRLDLPDCVRMHPVIHVSFLRPYVESDVHVRDDVSAQSYVHEGDISPVCINGRRVRDGSVQYLVAWSGDDEEETWESEAFCKARCPKLVEQFLSLPAATEPG